MLTYELRNWDGIYWSKDIPGGVETSPYKTKIMFFNGSSLYCMLEENENYSKAGFPKLGKKPDVIFWQATTLNGRHIFKQDCNSKLITNLTEQYYPSGDCFGYKISASGNKIIFMLKNAAGFHSIIMNIDGSSPVILAPEIKNYYMADLSPDDKHVVFAHADSNYTLMSKNLLLGESKTLLPALQSCFIPRFTPDGRQILFMRRGGEIYILTLNEENPKLLVNTGYDTFYISENDKHGSTDGFAISPDGSSIAFIAKVNSIPQLCTMNIDGSNITQITFTQNFCARPSYNREGDKLGFVSRTENGIQFFQTDLKGTYFQQLSHSEGSVYSYDW